MLVKGKLQLVWLLVLLLASFALVGTVLASPSPTLSSIQSNVATIGIGTQHNCSVLITSCPGWSQVNTCCSQGTGKSRWRWCDALEYCIVDGQNVVTEVHVYQTSCGSLPCAQ
jgi:hypothetical protein